MKSILRKAVVTVFAAMLTLSGLAGLEMSTASALTQTTTTTTTYYALDTGVTFAWKNSAGKWQTVGGVQYKPGGSYSMSHKFSVPSNAVIVHSGVYNKNATRGQRGYFPFKDTKTGEVALWSEPSLGKTKGSYDANYTSFAAGMSNSSSDKANPVQYSASLSSGTAYNVKDNLENGYKQQLLNLFDNNPPSSISNAMKLMDPSSETFNSNVEGYMWFTPTVIEYTITETVTVELGDLTADLTLPSTAKQNESYTVADASILSKEIYAKTALLEKSYDKSTWTEVTTWTGSKKGQNTGGSIAQSEANKGIVYYRITVTSDDGQVSTAQKQITITDSRVAGDFDVELNLPEQTYVGHPVEAVDNTDFYVEEEGTTYHYSAQKFYKNGLGKNRMESNAPDYTSSKKSGTYGATRIFTFNTPTGEDEYYTVTLEVETDSGGYGTDTKEIEVLDTPTIIDKLSGKQKENRKQVLDVKVATNPNVALKTLWVEIETEDGTEKVHLDHNLSGGTNTLNNSDLIKTRAITGMDSDKYYTNIQLLFLTKNTETKNFKYRIYAEDANGKSDLVEKVFTVAPDLAPEAALFTENTQLRNQGSETAEITVQDRSTTDSGDQLERTWYYREVGSNEWADAIKESLDNYINTNKSTLKAFMDETLTKPYKKDVTIEEVKEIYLGGISLTDVAVGSTTASVQTVWESSDPSIITVPQEGYGKATVNFPSASKTVTLTGHLVSTIGSTTYVSDESIVYNITLKPYVEFTWTTYVGSYGQVTDVCYSADGNVWLAVTDGGYIIRSYDGTEWESVSNAAGTAFSAIEYANGTWVAVSHSSASGIFYSTDVDGSNWSSVVTSSEGYTLVMDFCDVKYGNGMFIAVNTYPTGYVIFDIHIDHVLKRCNFNLCIRAIICPAQGIVKL